MAIEQPRPPQARSLLVLQDQLKRGQWAERHINALAEDAVTGRAVVGLLECAQDHHLFLQQNADKARQAHTRCVSLAP